MSRGKYILNKDNYRPKTGRQVPENYASLNVEILATTQKKNMSHWVLKNMPIEFVVRSNATWFPHNVCLTDKELKYLVLSSCPKGPIIIEHSNTIGLNFQVSKKYPYTLTILENFIKAKMVEVKNKAEILLTLEENTKYPEGGKNFRALTHVKVPGKENLGNLSSLKNMVDGDIRAASSPGKRLSVTELVDKARSYERLKIMREIPSNPSFGIVSSRDKLIVENNAIDSRPITAKGANFFSDNKDIDQKIITSEHNMKSEARAPLSTNSVPWMNSENEQREKEQEAKLNEKMVWKKVNTEKETFKTMIQTSTKNMNNIIGESKGKIFKEVMAIYSVKDKIVHKIADIDNFYSTRATTAKSPKNRNTSATVSSNIEYITNNLFNPQITKKPLSNFDYVQSKAEIVPFNPDIPKIIYDDNGKAVITKNRLPVTNKKVFTVTKQIIPDKNKDKDKNQSK